jgi:DNA-binding response OmpR family regulator
MYRIVVVDADPGSLARTRQILTEAEYEVSVVSSFEEAQRELRRTVADLLIADVRLGSFNGLHLVLDARNRQPQLPAILTHFPDPVFEKEARRLGIRYMTKPVDATNLLRLIERMLQGAVRAEEPSVRRWPRKSVEGGVAVTAAQLRAMVVDMSYGGLRLELSEAPEGTLPPAFEIGFPTLGVSVKAQRVWSRRATTSGTWWCGAELAESDALTTQAWRQLVDSIH